MCHLKAIENGCRHIDTAISAFAGGASHPPTETMVAALRGTEFDTGLDLEALQQIGLYFRDVRKKYHQFESEFTGLDTRVQVYQVPGGMISNLYTQLRAQGALERMNDVFKEIPRVRKDLGYPPLVTPTSQIVGTQAVLNVLTGKRYETITNEVKLYLQGRYGKAPAPIDPEVQRKAIGNQDIIDQRPADLIKDELDELRTSIGKLASSEEDVLTYAMFPEIGKEFLEQRQSNTLVPEPLEPVSIGDNGDQPRPTEFNVTLHGESYHIKVTGTGHRTQDNRPFYMTVDGVPEEVVVETLDEIYPSAQPEQGERGMKGSRRPRATLPGHVTTSMPGTIIDVLVSVGDQVEAGTPVLISEAMKMETEIQAPVAGTVSAVHVEKGDSVNPDETLVEIE
jgi:pyruvate carboxylase subunit B